MRRLVILYLFLIASAASAQEIAPEEFRDRRLRLAKALPDGLIVLKADKLATGEPGIDMNTARFDFSYLAGYYEEGAVLVIYGDTAVLFSRDPASAKSKAAVEKVRPLALLDDFLKATLPAAKLVYDWRHPWALENKLRSQVFRAVNPQIQVRTRLSAEVGKLRLIKSPAELACLRKAADATNKAHVAAMKKGRPGMNEKELQGVIEGTFRKEGCPTNAFPSIVGSGKNGVILHYMKNDMDMKAQTMVVVDIGAEYKGYAADITRTLPVDGKFAPEHLKAYQAVLDAQKAAERKLRPGATWRDLDRAAAEVLRDRGYRETGYMRFHGLGHWVGLSVHDSGSYRGEIRPGTVLTIEPGIYDRAKGYGIRIEDTYIVTKEGFERISAGAPREAKEIEALMKKE